MLNSSITQKRSLFFYLITLYFFLSPLEDLLSTEFGTILRYLAGMIALVWIFDSIRNNQRIELTRFSIIPIYLVGLSWFSTIWAYNLSNTVSRNIAYTLLPLLYVVIINRDYSRKELFILDSAILLGGIVTCLYGLYYTVSNFGFGSRLVISAQSDPNGLAGRVFLSLYISFKFIKDVERKPKIIYYACFFFILLSILSTGSRGAFVSLAVTLIIWIFDVQKKNWIRNISIILLILVGMLLILRILPEEIYMRIIGIESYTRDFQSEYSRTGIWKSFFTIILPKSPILGYGSGSAGLVMQNYHGRFQGMHNTYFNMWLEYGVFGLPLFVWLIYSIYKKLKNNSMIVEIGLLIGTMAIIFFLDAYAKKYLWNILSYLLISISLNKVQNVGIQGF